MFDRVVKIYETCVVSCKLTKYYTHKKASQNIEKKKSSLSADVKNYTLLLRSNENVTIHWRSIVSV